MTPTSPPMGRGARRDALCRVTRTVPTATLLFATLLAIPAEAGKPKGPFGKGDISKGELRTMLYRGAAAPFEITVLATRNDCQGSLELEIEWDEEDDEVEVKLEGKNALDPYPDVVRTEGVDYFPNPFFPEPEDYYDGRYQLWIVGAAGPITMFFYDPVTLDLLGSEHDFEAPPPAIPVPFPTLRMFATPMFQPKFNGDVKKKWEFSYSGMVRGDRPEFSHHLVTFPPPNLCGVDPNRLDMSTLRPYVTAPFPAAEARPWSEYLAGGLLFDVTVETPDYHTEPPRTNLAATFSGATAIAGGVPNGWTFDIDAAFMNVAPPIRPWPGAGTCQQYYTPFHTTGLNVCGGAS